jgi:hypothetical protein
MLKKDYEDQFIKAIVIDGISNVHDMHKGKF